MDQLSLACRQIPGSLKPACKCSIRGSFERVPDLDLKKEGVRGDFKKKAVFVVVEQMYQAEVYNSMAWLSNRSEEPGQASLPRPRMWTQRLVKRDVC
ncbi:hypothetical protein AC578_1590 [Pseudocercospora eumusae]|uniref:Uncharacterized protein n=1 Tax=Pseudocercospora eumusae TaxID=321146 RepID=A0A139HMD0_9PEZI|nr:hypothetical protein AC578_1590 [Pseudocercospora eumusae]